MRRSSLGFALKAAECLRVFGDGGQKLERDKATELHVLSFVNHTYPAAAELFDNAVMRNGLPNHWAEILGLGVGQVNDSEEVGFVPLGQLTKYRHFTHNPGRKSQLV